VNTAALVVVARTVEVPSHDGGASLAPRRPAARRLRWGHRAVPARQPTWSFLWCASSPSAPLHRIAPDQLSMGWSQRIARRSYRERVLDLADLLDALDVRGPVWLVAQDWGGAVAMGFAVAHPERVAGMVLSNTGIAVPEGRKAPWLIKLAATSGLHRCPAAAVRARTPFAGRFTQCSGSWPPTAVRPAAMPSPVLWPACP
jgi:pimeloyl-ACP methyl ester carboxylesterase